VCIVISDLISGVE